MRPPKASASFTSTSSNTLSTAGTIITSPSRSMSASHLRLDVQRGVSLVELDSWSIRVDNDNPDGIAIPEAGGVTDPQADPLPHPRLGNEVVGAGSARQRRTSDLPIVEKVGTNFDVACRYLSTQGVLTT